MTNDFPPLQLTTMHETCSLMLMCLPQDWSPDSCVSLVLGQTKEAGYQVTDAAASILKQGFGVLRERPGWANARDSIEMVNKLSFKRAKVRE